MELFPPYGSTAKLQDSLPQDRTGIAESLTVEINMLAEKQAWVQKRRKKD
jgi:hypothetical protein